MEKKLGLSALTALVLSSMLGAGVFSLPQNMAAVASPSALLIGWGITGVGILFLAFAMLLLTRIRPDLDGGIFTYAREGFGELIGFCSAWGYWLCAVIANVSYLVIVFSALSFFTDTPELRLFGDGNTWQAIVGASALLWIVHFLVLRGVQTAAGINLAATLAKLLPLGAFVALAAFAFRMETFRIDFSGLALGVPVWEQVKNTMLITLWVFIGVEGAVVVSARARNKRDVGRATLLAVLSALAVYLLVTLLSLGVVPRSELAEIRNPSMAGLMVQMMGPWGEIVIAAGLIISVCGAYLSWTIMAAEVPYLAATHKAFPRLFARTNKKQCAVVFAVAHQYQRAGFTGIDLVDRLGLQHAADDRLRDDSGPLFSGRRISAEDCPASAAQGGRRRSLHLWLMVIICVRPCAFIVVSDTLRSGSSGVPVCPSYTPARSPA
ncbi:Arginine/ornithine antiporter ArcD [Klebsiella oxytoca]|nr:Arginine/ornithine antiporter ArcD [Klebsiella oxytoca]